MDVITGSPPIDVSRLTIHLPSKVAVSYTVSAHLLGLEWELRTAQAFDALSEIRRAMAARSALHHYKNRFVRGQRGNTRSHGLLNSLKARAMSEAATYKRAWRALVALQAPLKKGSSWKQELRQLSDDDVRELSISAFDDDEVNYLATAKKTKAGQKSRPSEGRKRTSWIWMSHGIVADSVSDEHTHDSKFKIFFGLIAQSFARPTNRMVQEQG
jgi:hypothetical protein